MTWFLNIKQNIELVILDFFALVIPCLQWSWRSGEELGPWLKTSWTQYGTLQERNTPHWYLEHYPWRSHRTNRAGGKCSHTLPVQSCDQWLQVLSFVPKQSAFPHSDPSCFSFHYKALVTLLPSQSTSLPKCKSTMSLSTCVYDWRAIIRYWITNGCFLP